MTTYWKKLGQIYSLEPAGRHPKLISHAANPLPVHMKDDVYRVFFSGRDQNNRSSVGAVDIDIVQRKVIADHEQPFFEHGPKGSFFADGVSVGNCYVAAGVRYMLFMGWQSPEDGHWRGDIGRLVVTSDLQLQLDSATPMMGADPMDPISLSYPWVQARQGGGFDMWYGSTMTWDAGNGEMLHVIQHASSEDGQHWRRHGLAVPYELGVAQAFSRPTVIQNQDGSHEMWFSYRSGTGEKYRIGRAFGANGRNWSLTLKETGIAVSDHGWDAQMMEYPFVFDHLGQRFMLYNGNDYGRTGFGLAVMEQLDA